MKHYEIEYIADGKSINRTCKTLDEAETLGVLVAMVLKCEVKIIGVIR